MQSTLDLARPTVTEELAVAAQTPALSLGKLRGCGADDFSYNRAGQLSPAQRRMLHVDELNSSIGIAIGLGFGVLMIVQGFGLVAVVAVAVAIWQLGKIVVELDEIAHCAPVEEVGVAVPQLVTGDESADEYYLHINGKRLVLSREQYGWLVPGGPYRVHLLPRCRKVVSVEVLPGWRAEPNRVTERPKRFRIRFPTGE